MIHWDGYRIWEVLSGLHNSAIPSKMQQIEIVPTFTAQLDDKVLPNAHAIVDVDGDDLHDVVLGSINGTVAVYKISPTRFIKKQECRVNGCVSAICADGNMPNDIRIFVATADGSCFVIQATESGDDFFPSAEFRVALNVSDVILHRGFVVFGTREGSILVYSNDENAFGGFGHAHTFALGLEIESFVILEGEKSNRQILVRSTSGAIVEIELNDGGAVSSSRWRASSFTLERGALPYVVEKMCMAANGEDCVAFGSLAGDIEVLTQSGEVVWKYEVPEALVGLDKITTSNNVDALIGCTWSGALYVIADPSQIAHFRMNQPASSMFCADLLMSKLSAPTRVLFAISTFGTISIYLDLGTAVSCALGHNTLDRTLRSSAMLTDVDSPESRRELLRKLSLTSHLFDAEQLSTLLGQESVSISDLVRLATTTVL